MLLRLAVLAAALLPAATASTSAPGPPNPCRPATAAGARTVPFYLNTNRTGIIDLHLYRAQGARVLFFECVGDRADYLGSRQAPASMNTTSLYTATFFDCERLTRRFVGMAVLPDGSTAIGGAGARTSSCADRFALRVPRRTEPGETARVRVVDTWEIGGVAAQLCATSPKRQRECKGVRMERAITSATRRFRPSARGQWLLELRVGDHRARRPLAVGVEPAAAADTGAPVLLATGDSTMQGLESFLSEDLKATARVVGDVRPGLRLSAENPWAPIAAGQVRSLRPSVTVLSIGANEGLDMRTPGGARRVCCDEAWVAEYARRMRGTLKRYRQHGRGRVYALTMVAPRDPERLPIVTAVNGAIVRAAAGMEGVRVLRMDLLLSPGGYQEAVLHEGRRVAIREADGIHLNLAGLEIAAEAVARAVEQDLRAR